jgi:hypothetical protein
MGRPADGDKRAARDAAARDGLSRGLTPVQVAAQPAFAGMSLASAYVEACAALRRARAEANGDGVAVEAAAVRPERPPWGPAELVAYLTQLADVTAGLAGAADLARLAAALDPHLAAKARDAARMLAAEMDRRRDFELRLAERIHLAHEVLQRRAEKR